MITALTAFKSTTRGKPEYYLKNSLPAVNHDDLFTIITLLAFVRTARADSGNYAAQGK
jgi:hypothetical protein